MIESVDVHDFAICSCGACGVDGGLEYLKRMAGNKDCYEELSIIDEQAT